MLSSVCGIFGNAGQSNYAAGNTFQDALARYRVAKGQKSLAMDVGAVLSEGFVAENKDVMDRLLRLNLLQPNTMSEVFAIMDFVMSSPTLAADPAMAQVVMGLLLPAEIMARGLDVPLALKDPLFRHIHAADVTGKSVQGSNRQEKTFKTDFAEVFSIEKAGLVVTEALQSKISRVTGIAAAQIKTGDSLATYGIDSLVAVELKNWLEGEFSADIAVFEILGGATLEDIGMTTATRTTLQCKWQMQKVNGA
jgi:acyl carrier protein